MKKIILLLTVFFSLSAIWTSAPIAFAAMHFTSNAQMLYKTNQDISVMMEAATVWVVTHHGNNLSGGTGFIVGNGYIATNAHVVDKSGKNVDVYVLNERIPMQKASVVKISHESKETDSVDLAVLRFDPPKNVELPILSFSFNVKADDRVSAWGYPYSMIEKKGAIGKYGKLQAIPAVYSEGTINGIEQAGNRSGGFIIEHSVSLEDGYSGGPLVNEKGEVLGMNTWCRRSKENDEYLWSEAQTAVSIVYFLINNGITPKIAPGQQLPPQAKFRGSIH